MGNLATIFRRETAGYFNSAVAYIFIIVFILINAGLFMTQFFLISRAEMRSFFFTLPFTLSVFLPAVTMGSWAEEKKGNTIELLLTFPMSPLSLVLGKFFAALLFYLLALAATFTVPVMLEVLGSPDLGSIAAGYIGAALLGAFYLAIGLFISGLVRDQIVAFVLSMLACFGLYLLGMEFTAASIDGWIPGLGTFLQHFVGNAAHFETFAKGVIDNRDVLYFAAGIVLFLVLNGFWLEGRMRPGAAAIFSGAVAVSAGIFLLLNWFVSDLPLGRYDLTEGQLYTISDSTKKIIRELKSPVTAKLYVSPPEKMPTGMKTMEQDLAGKLDELRIASGGNFQYKIYHPDPANLTQAGGAAEESLEAQLQAKGILPFQVQSIEADEVGVKLIYAALALSYKEKPEEILPRLMPELLFNLEYMIASRIHRMTLDKKPLIALAAPFEEAAMDPNIAALLTQLGGGKIPERYRVDSYELISAGLQAEGFEVARIGLSEAEPIPEGALALFVLEPRNFTERQRYEINKFLTGGGSVFLAVQNYVYEYDPRGGSLSVQGIEREPEINPLLSAWGVEVDKDILVDRQSEVISMNAGPFSPPVPIQLPLHIIVTPAQMNQSAAMTERIDSLLYLWGSGLRIDEEAVKKQALEMKPLLYSSGESWTVPFKPIFTAEDLAVENGVRKGPFVLSLLLEGKFNDAFEGKPVPAWDAAAEEAAGAGEDSASEAPEETAEAEGEEKPDASSEAAADDADPKEAANSGAEAVEPKPGKLILTGAATMFQRQLLESGGHADFFLNAADTLTLGEDLVKIRAKKIVDRSIGRVSSAQKLFWRLFVTVLTPALIAAGGSLRLFARRRSKQIYMKSLSSGGGA